MDSFIFLIIIIIISLVIFLIISPRNIEPYTMGTVNQLFAKDQQDTYLTADAYKYIQYFDYYLPQGQWNYPTRITPYYYYPYEYAPYYPSYASPLNK